jgi:hypothetical protein
VPTAISQRIESYEGLGNSQRPHAEPRCGNVALTLAAAHGRDGLVRAWCSSLFRVGVPCAGAGDAEPASRDFPRAIPTGSPSKSDASRSVRERRIRERFRVTFPSRRSAKLSDIARRAASMPRMLFILLDEPTTHARGATKHLGR